MIRSRKIAFFIPTLNIGGTEHSFVKLANGFNDRGIKVQFVLSRKEGVLQKELSDSIEIIDLGNRRFSTSFFALKAYLQKEKPTHLITGSNMHNEFVVLVNCLSRYKTKVILTQRNFLDLEIKRLPVYGCLHRPLMKCLYPKAYKVVAVSKGILSFMKEFMPSLDVKHIYNPFNLENIGEASKKELENLPFSLVDEKYVVFIGRFVDVKNIPFLLEAYNILSTKHKELKLVLVGDGVLFSALKDKVLKLECCNRVYFVGSQANPYPFIRNAELLVLPSLSESLGGVLVEALALGVNVVATPTCGAKEVLNNGEFGYITRYFTNANAFANEMKQALENPTPREELLERAKVFDSENVVSQYLELLD